jgi:hypothetical protein
MKGQKQIAVTWSPSLRLTVCGGRGGALMSRFIVVPTMTPEYVAERGTFSAGDPTADVRVPWSVKLPVDVTVSGAGIDPEAQQSSREAPLEVTSISTASEPHEPSGMTVAEGAEAVPQAARARHEPKTKPRRHLDMALS